MTDRREFLAPWRIDAIVPARASLPGKLMTSATRLPQAIAGAIFLCLFCASSAARYFDEAYHMDRIRCEEILNQQRNTAERLHNSPDSHLTNRTARREAREKAFTEYQRCEVRARAAYEARMKLEDQSKSPSMSVPGTDMPQPQTDTRVIYDKLGRPWILQGESAFGVDGVRCDIVSGEWRCSSAHGTVPSKELVTDIQRLLATLGYRPGPPTGATNAATTAAVRAFQSDLQLTPTGEISEELRKLLQITNESSASRVNPETPR